MSDTPRTDAETWRDEMDHVDTDYTFAQSITVSADFARQLERELAEARKQRDTLAEALEECKGWTHRAVELEVSVPKALAQAQSIVKAESALAAVKGGCDE